MHFRSLLRWSIVTALGVSTLLATPAQAQYLRESLAWIGTEIPGHLVQNHTQVQPDPAGHWRVTFLPSDWPNITFAAPEGSWDWSEYAGLGFALRNPGEEKLRVSMRIDNAGADGAQHCNTASERLDPGEARNFEVLFHTGEVSVLWGMRGVPREPDRAKGDVLDRAAVVAFQLFLSKPETPHTLLVEDIYLIRRGHQDATPVPLPFVDRFGQFIHDDWPGKVGSEEELIVRRDEERARYADMPVPEDFDTDGGWKTGPQREATGWFRTEEVGGTWWLVTPEGRLFFSTGIDCVGTWRRTFVAERQHWFAWLPREDDPRFGRFYGMRSGAHSMAERINGEGLTFGFYPVNLVRKYGRDWQAQWRAMAYARLRAWGFNTIGNWSQQDILAQSPIPYTVSTTIDNVRAIEAATGYWAKMKDVYAPEFEPQVDRAVKQLAAGHADNPRCIGYFVDNELAWEGVKRGAIESPANQPARIALLVFLEDRYRTLDALNAAWETDFTDWAQIRREGGNRDRIDTDLNDYLHAFARRYFETIAAAFDRYAPKQLYLGCRFSIAPDPVVRACAEVADVVSFNRYARTLSDAKFIPAGAPSKPVLIGEFHFGALDRGMFHTGLVPVDSQEARAAAYTEYVTSALERPDVVGTHWFQFVDEPLTGRYYDGENYNIGFVDVTDTPYPELTCAAAALHARMYRLRYGVTDAAP